MASIPKHVGERLVHAITDGALGHLATKGARDNAFHALQEPYLDALEQASIVCQAIDSDNVAETHALEECIRTYGPHTPEEFDETEIALSCTPDEHIVEDVLSACETPRTSKVRE